MRASISTANSGGNRGLSHGENFPASDERDLIRSAQAGDRASLNKLAVQYTPLVCKIAAGYGGSAAIAAGNLGLAEAIRDFDLGANNKFITFASHKIRNAIRPEARKEFAQGRTGLPDGRADRYIYKNASRIRDAKDVAENVGCLLSVAEAALDRFNALKRRDVAHHKITDHDGDFQQTYVPIADRQRRQISNVRIPKSWGRPWSHSNGALADLTEDPTKAAGYVRDGSAQILVNIEVMLHDLNDPGDFHGRFPRAAHEIRPLELAKKVDKKIDGLLAGNEQAARNRLKQIGRRAYALELVDRDRAKLPPSERAKFKALDVIEPALAEFEFATGPAFDRPRQAKVIPLPSRVPGPAPANYDAPLKEAANA